MNEFFRRINYLLHRGRLDRELANDMDFHREMAERTGATLGNSLRLREEARDAWGWVWIDRLAQDLRYATRVLRKSPGFTLAAVLTLAVGIGVNVAAFSFFDKAALTPLPVRDPDSILRLQRVAPHHFASDLPYREMAFVRDHARTLSAVLAENDNRISVEGNGQQVNARFVTTNFFTELGSGPMLGRLLDPALDENPGAEPVVVLGFGFWNSQFHGDPSIVGKTIRLNGRPTTVVGVTSEKFTGLRANNSSLWLPLTRQPEFISGSKLLTDFKAADGVQMWARLRPGVSAKAAEDETRALLAELRRSEPTAIWEKERLYALPGAYVTSPHGHSAGDTPSNTDELTPVLSVAGALSLLILAVACGNLGSLLMARGVARQREISIRTAVGAGRGRLVRQLFTESLVLAFLGTAAGLVLGYAVLRGLLSVGEAPAWMNPAPDWLVISFSAGIGFFAAVLFGLMPALQMARQKHRSTVMRPLLIGAQVAGSCVLLIVASLLVRALDRAANAFPGFEYEQVVTLSPRLSVHGYSIPKASAFIEQLRNRLRGVAGIESVALTSVPPLGGTVVTKGIQVNGRELEIHITSIDGDFFRTMGIPLLRGRTFRPGEKNAVIVGQSFANVQWPGQDPLGKQFPSDDARKYTVIGLAGTARVVDRQNAEGVEAYFPVEAEDMPSISLLVKTSGPPSGLLPFLIGAARAGDSQLFPEATLLKTSFHEKLQGSENTVMAVGVLGGVALLLACSGIVGLVAYSVSQRTKEIGIRMALGARPPNVLYVAIEQLAKPVAIGSVVGVGAAAALSQVLRRQLYGVSHLDPLAYLAALLIFAVTVAAAAILPARRALRVNPVQALRCD
jgi:predicted permease